MPMVSKVEHIHTHYVVKVNCLRVVSRAVLSEGLEGLVATAGGKPLFAVERYGKPHLEMNHTSPDKIPQNAFRFLSINGAKDFVQGYCTTLDWKDGRQKGYTYGTLATVLKVVETESVIKQVDRQIEEVTI